MKKKILISLTMALLLTSCAYNQSLVNTSYKVLSVSQTTYDTVMKAVADLDERNLLERSERAKILEVANTYHNAHNSAVDALAAYQETKSQTDQERLETQIAAASDALTNLLNTIKPYLE